jgi:hypothetical protein
VVGVWLRAADPIHLVIQESFDDGLVLSSVVVPQCPPCVCLVAGESRDQA